MPVSGARPRLLQPGHLPDRGAPASLGSLLHRLTTLPVKKMGMKCLNGVFCTSEQPGPPGPGRRDAAASAPLPDPRFPQRQLLLAPEIQGHILGVVPQRLRREPVSAQSPGEPGPARRPSRLHRGSRPAAAPAKGPGSGPAAPRHGPRRLRLTGHRPGDPGAAAPPSGPGAGVLVAASRRGPGPGPKGA